MSSNFFIDYCVTANCSDQFYDCVNYKKAYSKDF